MGPGDPQEPAAQRRRHKNIAYLANRHDVKTNFGLCLQKMDFRLKHCIFSPKKGHFSQSGPKNDQPSSQMGTYLKTKVV